MLVSFDVQEKKIAILSIMVLVLAVAAVLNFVLFADKPEDAGSVDA